MFKRNLLKILDKLETSYQVWRTKIQLGKDREIVSRTVDYVSKRFQHQPSFYLRRHSCGSITLVAEKNSPACNAVSAPVWGEQMKQKYNPTGSK